MPSFYFDLGSPYAYLTAARIGDLIEQPLTWQPILLGGLFRANGRSSWAVGDHERRAAGMAEVERRARDYGLGPIVWPEPWPGDYLMAMRAATFAFAAGCGRQFCLEAFRAAFRNGHDLGDASRLLDVGERVGLDRRELDDATRDPQIKAALRAATDAAHARGVIGVPTIAIGDRLFWGDDQLAQAADDPNNQRPAGGSPE